jgi:LPXTG-site transpeptidase (sortase) family protein
MKRFLAWLLLIQSFSLLTVGAYQLYLHETPSLLAFNNYHVQESKASSKKDAPINIMISRVGINLPIYTAKIVNNVWQTTDLGASYLTTSPLPGSMGNSIIYGHNWTSLFGKLVNVKVGDKVVVTYPDHTHKTFIIAYTSVVSPDESSILAPSKDKRITLYTCTGLFDSKRFVVVAVLQQS